MESNELGREVEEVIKNINFFINEEVFITEIDGKRIIELLQAQQTEIKELHKALNIMYVENNRLREKLKKGDGKK